MYLAWLLIQFLDSSAVGSVVPTTGLILLLLPCFFLTTSVIISVIHLSNVVGLTFGVKCTGILGGNQTIDQGIHGSEDNLLVLCGQ